MLAKLTSKNQLTLPKSVTQAVGATEYLEVEARAGQIILTPVRIQRGDAVRAKLAELDLTPADVDEAVGWARSTATPAAQASEPAAAYGAAPDAEAGARPAKRKKPSDRKPDSRT